MKTTNLFFRADGSTVAGYGHVLRSLALASMLKDRYRCIFIIREPDAFLQRQIKKTCKASIVIPASLSVKEELEFIKGKINKQDIVVLDGYGFKTNYQKQLKKCCFKLVSIDDIHETHFVSDVIINHGEGITKKNYSTEAYSKVYLGVKYTILRKPFLKKRESERVEHKEAKEGGVFISLGGTDQQNYTERAVKLCLQNKEVKRIDVVIGGYYQYKSKLEAIQKSNPKVKLKIHSNLSAKEISSLMQRSAIGICSASTVAYEYASVGGLLFLYQTVANQKNIYAFMIKLGLAYSATEFKNRSELAWSKKKIEGYYKNRQKYFSGSSAKNLVEIFNQLELERDLVFRRAAKSDVKTYFKWVNEPEVRKNSVNTAPITFEQHVGWFEKRIKNKQSALYIFEKKGKALGQVRFDRSLKTAEIDYSIDKRYRGQGYGKLILEEALRRYRNINKGAEIKAKVKTENLPSCRVFERLGFETGPRKDGYSHYKLKIGQKINN